MQHKKTSTRKKMVATAVAIVMGGTLMIGASQVTPASADPSDTYDREVKANKTFSKAAKGHYGKQGRLKTTYHSRWGV